MGKKRKELAPDSFRAEAMVLAHTGTPDSKVLAHAGTPARVFATIDGSYRTYHIKSSYFSHKNAQNSQNFFHRRASQRTICYTANLNRFIELARIDIYFVYFVAIRANSWLHKRPNSSKTGFAQS
jgi:hypothetical protein